MTPDEATEWLRGGGRKLAFDTNALFSHSRLLRICKDVTLYNGTLKRLPAPAIELYVPAAAHAEKLFDLKQKWGGAFDETIPLRGFHRMGLQFLPFDEKHAMRTAIELGSRYATDTAWHEAKKRRCLGCLGLRQASENVPGSGKRCAATIDWLIRGQALAEGWLLVTDDSGSEFAHMDGDRVKLGVLEAALGALLFSRTPQSTLPDGSS